MRLPECKNCPHDKMDDTVDSHTYNTTFHLYVLTMNRENHRVTTLNENDVLLGRGGRVYMYNGNQQLRDLAQSHLSNYNRAVKSGKPLIAKEITSKIQTMYPPGRFLKKVSKKNEWREVSNVVAVEKVSQVLRDIRRRSSSKETAGTTERNGDCKEVRTATVAQVEAKHFSQQEMNYQSPGAVYITAFPSSNDFLPHHDLHGQNEYHYSNQPFSYSKERNSLAMLSAPRQHHHEEQLSFHSSSKHAPNFPVHHLPPLHINHLPSAVKTPNKQMEHHTSLSRNHFSKFYHSHDQKYIHDASRRNVEHCGIHDCLSTKQYPYYHLKEQS
jgi:hypothetical protein